MFQYAAARALALRTGAELVLDSWSGFVRDHQYQRHFELHLLPIHARVATALERAPIWLFRAHNKIHGQDRSVIQERLYGNFLVETELRFFKDVAHYHQTASAWLVGYWQSPLYFQDYTDTLLSELMPPPPAQGHFLDLGRTLRETDSVALGIRLYEESVNPAAHAKDGQIKTVAEVNAAISRLRALRPNANFFVFCTHRSPILAELNLPDTTMFVTHDDGYGGSIEVLWLLTQCKHHIFTNSSYYWWGAWLSSGLHSATHEPQHIFAADNFINQDGLCSTWQRF